MVRRGQATVEFTLVILAFVTLLFGTIEAARAINTKDRLTRAAETIAHELAYTDPNVDPINFSMNPTFSGSQSYIDQAIADANKNAGFSLGPLTYSSLNNTCPPPPLAPPLPNTELACGYYNPGTNPSYPPSTYPNTWPYAYDNCTGGSGLGTPACQSITSADGNVVIVGFPDLSTTGTQEIRVTVCQPFTSVIGHFGFKDRPDGKACETVTATTLANQTGPHQISPQQSIPIPTPTP